MGIFTNLVLGEKLTDSACSSNEYRASSTPPTFWNREWKTELSWKRSRSTPPEDAELGSTLVLVTPEGILVDRDGIPLDPLVEETERAKRNARVWWGMRGETLNGEVAAGVPKN